MGAVRRVVSTSSLENETQQQDDSDFINDDDVPSLQSIPRSQNYKQKARVYICSSYLLSEISEWIFQFSTVVWLTSIGDSNNGSGSSSVYSSLFLNSAYQATSQLLVCFLVPRITTRYVSNNNHRFSSSRQTSMSYIIRMQIPCIFITTLLFGMLLVHHTTKDENEVDGLEDNNNATEVAQDVNIGGDSILNGSHFIILIIIYICGGLAQVFQQSYSVAIDRDWVVAISHCSSTGGGDDEQWLTTTNTILKQIHLVCIILGPSIAVLLHSSSQSDAIWVGLIKITSLVLMNVLLNRCYQTTPSLQQSEESSINQSEEERRTDTPDAEDDVDHVSSIIPKKHKCSYINDLQVFLSQEAVYAGLALALLYCNVLTFGGVMTAYLSSCGMPWSVIGICQGLSNFSGLIGTCVFAISQRYLNVRTTTMIGICWQFICLTLVISGVLMNLNQTDKLLSAKVIIAFVIPSRIGLWVFALASTQLYQQTVKSKYRGQVGGTQTSLNSMFEFIPFILGMVYSDVDDYWIVMVVSYMSVTIATLMVTFGVFIPHQRKRMKAEYDNIELELEDMTTRSSSNNGIV